MTECLVEIDRKKAKQVKEFVNLGYVSFNGNVKNRKIQ